MVIYSESLKFFFLSCPFRVEVFHRLSLVHWDFLNFVPRWLGLGCSLSLGGFGVLQAVGGVLQVFPGGLGCYTGCTWRKEGFDRLYLEGLGYFIGGTSIVWGCFMGNPRRVGFFL